MKHRYWAALLVMVGLCGRAGAEASPASQPVQTQFLRYEGDADSGRLEAAIVSYRNARTGATVDLVSAIHVADRAYFSALSQRFPRYDAVLYEMVKARGMAPPKPGEDSGSGVSRLQRFIKQTLGLEFQLDQIDYHARNFVHADLDAETFRAKEAERGESIFTLMLQSMMEQMFNPKAQAPGSRMQNMTLPELLAILAAPDRPRQLKLLLAPEFGDIDSMMGALTGPKGSVLVTERNKAAIAVLRSQLKRGRRHLAIFYGAAHMRDMEGRLEGMGFSPVKTEWLTAWDIPAAASTQPAAPAVHP